MCIATEKKKPWFDSDYHMQSSGKVCFDAFHAVKRDSWFHTGAALIVRCYYAWSGMTHRMNILERFEYLGIHIDPAYGHDSFFEAARTANLRTKRRPQPSWLKAPTTCFMHRSRFKAFDLV
jgi:hypothetical protein